MKALLGLALVAVLSSSGIARAAARGAGHRPRGGRILSPAESVNLFMGTSNEGASFSRGNQYPAVHTPFGMNAWSVGTASLQSPWFYDYKGDAITGVKLTHQTTVWGDDFAALDLMPMTGGASADPIARRSPYRRASETAHPYYYANTLDRYGITFELAPSPRGAILRFRYPAGEVPYLALHGAGAETAKVIPDGERAIEGRITNGGVELFFRLELDRPIRKLDASPSCVACLALARGATGAENTIVVKLATSYVSAAQAADNLALELAGETLESLTARAKAAWEDSLGRIAIEGGRPEDRVTFYSALYRALAFPKIHWEPVGRDVGRSQYRSPFDGKVHLDRKLWTGNGFWDSYRAVWPLFTILFPDLTGEMLDGWVNSYRDGGWTVRWSKPGYWECMIGTHTDIVFADALVKGIRNWDFLTGYEAAVKNAMVPGGHDGKGRRFLERSAFLGYVPWTGDRPDDEVGSRTVEDSINDFGISVLARVLGKQDDARYFANRAKGYSLLWDPKSRFFRSRDALGRLAPGDADFDPYAWRYAWTEGNAWHYRVSPLHDGAGLRALFGGPKGLEKALDEIFQADTRFGVGGYGTVIHEMTEAEAIGKKGFGQFALGNEPVHHLPHLYVYAGKPSKTQYWVRRALTELYESGTGTGHGYPGDEDAGQMSAWFVMNAMGLYSAAPGHAEYILTTPLFPKVRIAVGPGRAFEIHSGERAPDLTYIARAELDGHPYDKAYLRHATLATGGRLALTLSAQPTRWAEARASLPSSLTPVGETPRYRESLTRGATAEGPAGSPAGETADRLVDQNSATKWLVFARHAAVDVTLAREGSPDCYTLTSAGDVPARDPRAWRLSGSRDGRAFTTLDERRDVRWKDRRETKLFCFPPRGKFRHFRLEITENGGAPELQLAELELLDLS